MESLAWGAKWEHRLGTIPPSCRITLRDGRKLDTALLRGTINRLICVPPSAVALARPEERQYVLQELTSLFMSWLYGLPGVVLNRATPQGLGGDWKHSSQWSVLAANAGLSVYPYRLAASTRMDRDVIHTPIERLTFFVLLGSQVVGPEAPPRVTEACRRLARLSGEGLIGIELTKDFHFVDASPMPDLRLGGAPFLDALAGVLKGDS